MSEVRGLTKSKSISSDGDYLTIKEVVVDVDGKQLIDKAEGDILVPISGRALYHRWIKLQDENNMQHITFHDLRHPYVKYTLKNKSLQKQNPKPPKELLVWDF